MGVFAPGFTKNLDQMYALLSTHYPIPFANQYTTNSWAPAGDGTYNIIVDDSMEL